MNEIIYPILIPMLNSLGGKISVGIFKHPMDMDFFFVFLIAPVGKNTYHRMLSLENMEPSSQMKAKY